MPKFTQGKWEISDDGCIEIYDEKGLLVTGIAEVADYNTSEGQANARLIAAAPEMYKRLKYIVFYILTVFGKYTEDKISYSQISNSLLLIADMTIELLAQIDGEDENA